MKHHYPVKAGEQFNADSCPMVISQLVALQKAMEQLPDTNKDIIVISFLKNHSLSNECIASNPEVAKQLIAGSFAVSQIEAYFDVCKHNKIFLADFEDAIRSALKINKAAA